MLPLPYRGGDASRAPFNRTLFHFLMTPRPCRGGGISIFSIYNIFYLPFISFPNITDPTPAPKASPHPSPKGRGRIANDSPPL